MKKLISTAVVICSFITVVTAQDTTQNSAKTDLSQNPVTDTVPQNNNNDTSFYKTDPATEDSTIYNRNQDKKPSDRDKNIDSKQDKAGDRVYMRDNKMFVVKNGKTTSLTKNLQLEDGSTVMPDGTIKLRDGSTMKLNNGEHIKLRQ